MKIWSKGEEECLGLEQAIRDLDQLAADGLLERAPPAVLQAVQGALVRRLAEEGEAAMAVLRSRVLLSCPPELVMQALQAALARLVTSSATERGSLDFACQVINVLTLCRTLDVFRKHATCSSVTLLIQ